MGRRPAPRGLGWRRVSLVLADGLRGGDQSLNEGALAMSEIRQQDQLAPGLGAQDQRYARRTRLRVPPNLFGVPLGLAGLPTAWHAAGAKLGTPTPVPDTIDILAAIALLLLGWLYAAQGPRRGLADLRGPLHAPLLP